MKADASRLKFDSVHAMDQGLAAWLGWFSREPCVAELTDLIEQLEAAYGAKAPREPMDA